MKMKFIQLLFFVSLLAACGDDENKSLDVPVTPPDAEKNPVENENKVEISNASFEDGLDGWERVEYANGAKTTLEVVDGEGVNNSKALKIQQLPENGICSVGVKRTLKGLVPDEMYRMTARIRYSDIPENQGTGPVLFRPNEKQYWNSSRYLYGTNLKNWTTVTVDFMSDDNGEAEIVAALGFWQGGLPNKGRSTGTAYFDNISVVKVTNELDCLESEHIRLFIDPNKIKISTSVLRQWLEEMDKVYESYAELMGSKPHEGRKLAIQTTTGMYSGYWAVAGYPIVWNGNNTIVEDALAQIEQYDDWCFGLMHEMGHVFNIGDSRWNWNDEMFANFRMHYALAQNNGKVYMDGRDGKQVYTGGEILDMYKIDYEKTIGTKVNDNGIHYMLARMADDITWEPYKKTFDWLRRHGYSGSTNYGRFENFVNTLDKYAKEANPDINLWDKFTELEISSIKEQLK